MQPTPASSASRWRQGTEHRIKDERPLIFHPDEALASGLQGGYADAIARYRESLPEHVRTLFDRYPFCDLAMKVVGVVGLRPAAPVRAHAHAHALARAHVRSGDAALISGYAGSGQTLDDAIADFAVAYSDQNRTDYRSFIKAVRQGKIEVIVEG